MTAASAPGKLLLCGEYAVLEGAPAMVMAVNRRAHAQVATGRQRLSPFLAAARDALTESAWRARAERVFVDTSALQAPDGTKLGLGSSAAAVVAALACAAERTAAEFLHPLAHTAHAAAQARSGVRGSGVDVAASVHGGLLVVEPSADLVAPPRVRAAALPAELSLHAVWTGVAADTRALVPRVTALRERDAGLYSRRIHAIAEASHQVIAAMSTGLAGPARAGAAAVVAALAQAGAAVAALGQDAGVPLWTAAHADLQARVAPLGGVVKPTGAGAGDIALLAAAEPNAAERFVAAGIKLLPLAIDPVGARLEPAKIPDVDGARRPA